MKHLADAVDYLLENADFKGTNIGLSGELGSGKTHFTRALLTKLDPEFSCQIVSPTYSYCMEYRSADRTVNHFDLYRVESEQKLWEIGFFESLEDDLAVTLAEWHNRFPMCRNNFDFLLRILQEGNERRYEIIHNAPETRDNTICPY